MGRIRGCTTGPQSKRRSAVIGIPRARVTHGRAARLLLPALAAGVVLVAAAPGASAATFERRPVLFVHGFESAGSNFASQAMRFESNGYPPSWGMELDYDHTAAVGNQ